MREHNYPARFYEYVRNGIHNMFTDNEIEQTIEDAIREHMINDTNRLIEKMKEKKDLNNFKFFSK
jgi:hypothetical protein